MEIACILFCLQNIWNLVKRKTHSRDADIAIELNSCENFSGIGIRSRPIDLGHSVDQIELGC